jgi:hypothetical protein
VLDGLRPVDGTHNANQAAAAKGRVAATPQSFIIPADSGIPPTAQVVDAGGGLVREIPVVQALELLIGERPLSELRG